MTYLESRALHWPIGTVAFTGQPCPETGIYKSTNGNYRSICWRGKYMPNAPNGEALWELESHLVS